MIEIIKDFAEKMQQQRQTLEIVQDFACETISSFFFHFHLFSILSDLFFPSFLFLFRFLLLVPGSQNLFFFGPIRASFVFFSGLVCTPHGNALAGLALAGLAVPAFLYIF